MKVKAKSIQSGRIIEKTFRADEKVTQAIVEKKKMQFLYKESENFVFMDTDDYSQMYVSKDAVADKSDYLIEGEEAELSTYEGGVLDIELPPQVKLKVVKAAPGIKGDTVSGGTKKVELETGLVLDVPLFINEGENIIVDTRNGEYVSRTD